MLPPVFSMVHLADFCCFEHAFLPLAVFFNGSRVNVVGPCGMDLMSCDGHQKTPW